MDTYIKSLINWLPIHSWRVIKFPSKPKTKEKEKKKKNVRSWIKHWCCHRGAMIFFQEPDWNSSAFCTRGFRVTCPPYCAPDYRHTLLHSSQTYQRVMDHWSLTIEPVLINLLPMINALLQVLPYEQAKLQEIQLNEHD